jgi:hypothetical protein
MRGWLASFGNAASEPTPTGLRIKQPHAAIADDLTARLRSKPCAIWRLLPGALGGPSMSLRASGSCHLPLPRRQSLTEAYAVRSEAMAELREELCNDDDLVSAAIRWVS